MNEVTYSYYAHQKELKNIARSAKRKVVNRKLGKIMMPSDYLSAKEKKELNGTVATYEMNKPHSYKELQAWPESYQKEYLENIIERFQPKTMQLMQDLLHTSWKPFTAYMERLGLTEKMKSRKHRTAEEKEAWRIFIEGKDPEPEVEPEPKPEVKKAQKPMLLAYPERFTVNTVGKPLAILNTIAQLYCDPDKEYKIYVHAVQKPLELPQEHEQEEYIDSIPEDEF